MRFLWHSVLNAIALEKDPPYHGDRRGFGSYAAQTFVSPTFNSCFLDSGVNTQRDSLGVESVELHDIPTAQSAHVFSVGPGHWKMSEQKGLTGSSDGAANWQL